MKTKVNRKYRFTSSLWDKMMPPHGVITGELKEGDIVKVVNLPGCPKNNTMDHSYVQSLDGKFLGMVSNGSLTPVKKKGK